MNQSTEIIKMSSDEALNGKCITEWLNLHEFAVYVGVSERTISQWYKENNSAINYRMVPNPHGGKAIRQYAKDSTNGKLIAEWLAKNQLHKARNSSVGSAAVEYVTKDMVQSIVSAAVEAATIPLLETISILKEDNKKLHEQLNQLLEAPKTLSLPSGQTVHPLKAVLPLDSFCKYMEIPTPVLLSKKSPLSGGKPIKDFPLTTLEQFLSYVSYILEEGFSSAQRYSWLQSHPKAAQKLGYI